MPDVTLDDIVTMLNTLSAQVADGLNNTSDTIASTIATTNSYLGHGEAPEEPSLSGVQSGLQGTGGFTTGDLHDIAEDTNTTVGQIATDVPDLGMKIDNLLANTRYLIGPDDANWTQIGEQRHLVGPTVVDTYPDYINAVELMVTDPPSSEWRQRIAYEVTYGEDTYQEVLDHYPRLGWVAFQGANGAWSQSYRIEFPDQWFMSPFPCSWAVAIWVKPGQHIECNLMRVDNAAACSD